jgi:hypothetical protein
VPAYSGRESTPDRARLGPEASGFLHNLVDEAPRPIDVLVPVGRSARIGGEWRFSRECPSTRSARSVGDPPRLTVEDRVRLTPRDTGLTRTIMKPALFLIRVAAAPWVISPAVACLSGLKSAPRKRVRGNPPRVQIPPPPPTDKAKRWPRHTVGAGVRSLGLIFGLIWLHFDRLLRCLGSTRAARRADSPPRCESEQRRVRSGLPSPSLTIPERS